MRVRVSCDTRIKLRELRYSSTEPQRLRFRKFDLLSTSTTLATDAHDMTHSAI